MLPRLPTAPAGSETLQETLKYLKSSAMKLVRLQLQITSQDKGAYVEDCLSCLIS